ncbi:guanylate-binding protein 1-like isoform X2 [Hoplias malabaricus]|uniref:guanylate-binding protein 1-like isoform X2 n=1 Tax=Hoplias malabaricus TaxID=27720 RepID=UPI003462D467
MEEPVCLVENVDGSLCLGEGAQYLNDITDPIVVVSVVGLYRTGKSYLMNQLAGKHTGFALGSTIESKTKGIWMWCVPHPSKPGHTLVLLDTEGLGDVDKGDSKNDAWVFCLAVLLSSTLIYNSRGTIDNTAVENLHFVTELADHIRINSPSAAAAEEDEEEPETSQFVQFFPKFIWTVRDFILELEIEKKGRVTEDQYLDFALQLKKGIGKKISDYNLPRECIRNYFPSRKCFVFPLPATQDKMSHLESLDESELWPDFLTVTRRFCDYVFKESEVKTVKGGHRVTGRMLGHLVRVYVDMISGNSVPCLENAVVVMSQIENQAAVQQGMEVYERGMEQVRSKFPVSVDEISGEHQKFSNLATTEFMKRSFKDQHGEYLRELSESVDERYTELLEENTKSSETKCRVLLSQLYSGLSEAVQKGDYTTPGGYSLYCTHRENIIREYNTHPNKGVQAEDVLEEFLKQWNVEANAILQTDNKLTENERKIEEERERAALIEQKQKAAEEKQREMEQVMKVEKESNQERMQQMERKFQEEWRQQQEELEKAVESKLCEQKVLLEKNYKDKAELMGLEIEQLKKEKVQSQGSFKEIFLPLVEAGKGVLSNILDYKLAKSKIKSKYLGKISSLSQNNMSKE